MRCRAPLNKMLVSSYVVRIYRRNSDNVIGIVEDVQSGRSMPFSSMEDLWNALRERVPSRSRSKVSPIAPE